MGYENWIEVPKAAPAPASASRNAADRHAFFAILAVAMATAVLVRFWGLGSRALWLDESYSAWFSELSWYRLWFETPRYETHPPFYYSLLKLWRGLAGDDAAALRSLSAMSGVLAVPVAAIAALALGRACDIKRPLLLILTTCALMALSPRLVVIGQDARPYALLLLSYAAALACWLRLTLSFRGERHPEGRALDWAGLGLATAVSLWLHGLGLLHAAALFGALLLTAVPGATPARWKRFVITASLVGLVYLPCFLIILGRSGDWSGGWASWDPARFPGALLDLYGLHEQTEPWTPIAARILFALLIGLGLRALWHSGERGIAAGLGLLILLPPLAAALLSSLGQPVFVPRALVAVLAPAYLAAACGLAKLPLRSAALLASAAALIVLTNLAETLSRPSLEAWDELALVLKREMQPNDVVWVYPNEAVFPVERALGGPSSIAAIPAPFPALNAKGSRPAASPGVVGIDAAAARRWANDQRSPAGATVWLVISNPGLFDPNGEVARGLAEGRRSGPTRAWRQMTLYPLLPAQGPAR